MKLSRLTRSRGGRVALAAVPATIAVSALMTGVAYGAVPVSFAVSGTQFKISASHMHGDTFSQYSGVAADANGGMHPVAIANIGTASLANLCQSVVANTPLGKIGLLINAGGGNNPATASGLQIGMTDMQGDATFKDIRIGVDASTVITNSKGTKGDFAQDASSMDVDNLKQTAWSTTAGTFVLNGMHMQLTNGQECF
jgi:opacity protein-like surface antigen